MLKTTPDDRTTDSKKPIWVKSKSGSRLSVAEVVGRKYALSWIPYVEPVKPGENTRKNADERYRPEHCRNTGETFLQQRRFAMSANGTAVVSISDERKTDF